MSQKHHVRSATHKVLPAHARPSKPPPLLKRGHNYNNGHGQPGSSKLGPGGSKKTTTEVVQQDEEQDEDMASFLQFCPTCERQIVTPGISILYCSESCRRKDVSNMSPVLTTHSPTTSYFEAADIIPQRSPTVVRPLSLTFSDLSFDDAPSIAGDDEVRQRRDSEAARYLAEFHSTTWTGVDQAADRRPRFNRASTTADSSGLPSLIHTPSSSIASNASVPAIRPLPSRHNKSYSACSAKPIDLVTPYTTVVPSSPTQLMKDSSMKSSASTLTSFRVAESADLSYDKQTTDRRGSEAHGSLKQLFRHEAMKAPPTQASQLSRLE